MNISPRQLDSLIKKLTELPPTPQILPKLQKLLQDEDITLLDIASLIKIDASLTAQIIRLSNSSYFGRSEPCENLEEAISRIGFNEVYQLVSTLSFKKIIDRGVEVYGFEPGELWELSLSTAVSCEAFAAFINQDINTAYTLGIVHSIGKVVINHAIAQKKCGIDTKNISQRLSIEEEINILGFNYAQAGGSLLRSWGFPKLLWETIEHQLDPLNTTSPGNHIPKCMLALSIHAGKQLIGLIGKEETFDEKFLAAIEIDTESIPKIMQHARQRLGHIEDLLGTF